MSQTNARPAGGLARYALQGRTALVTGGASGIGLATTTMLVEGGATVAINHLPDDPRGQEVVARLAAAGHRVVGAPGDVGVAGEAEAMVEAAIGRLGRLDLLVNNAGTPGGRQTIPPKALDRIDEAFWHTLLEVNLIGPFRCTKAAAAALRKARGAVVNTASIAGLGAVGSSMVYGATKAGLISLTKNFARALAPEARVNAVAPGAVDSTWQVEWTNDERSRSIDNSLLRRRSTPEDIAEAIMFLAFGTTMVTGHTLVVDGGLTV